MKKAEDDDHDESMHGPASTHNSDNEMETSFTTFQPKVAANPLYESAGRTGQGAATGLSNPLYEPTSVAGMGGANSIENPLYESTFSLTGVGGAQVATNPLYEPMPTEEELLGEVNHGASDDEDGDDAKRVG